MTRASGVGSWPGTDPRAANGTIRNLLADNGIPYLAELPARGPGADVIGRGAGLLVDLPVELTPSGWRHADAPGRDLSRARGYLGSDLDALAEIYDGHAGPLKLQITGPWTLAASIELPRGERTLTDAGATADIVASLAEGVIRHVATVQGLLPHARLIVQIDEPSLPAVLAGRLPTASGYGRVRAVDPAIVQSGLGSVISAVAQHDPVIHCCDPGVPLPLLRRAGAAGVSMDVTAVSVVAWESVAASVEERLILYAGCLPADRVGDYRAAVAELHRAWLAVGLERTRLDDLVVTPACGIPGVTPADARRVLQASRDAAAALTEEARA